MKPGGRFTWYIAPSLLQGGISFIVLPIATLVLGPADYGMYALVISITAVAGAIAGMSAAFPLAAHFEQLDDRGRLDLVTTMLGLNLLIALVLGAVITLVWLLLADKSMVLTAVPKSAVVIAVISMIIASPWTIGVELSTLLGEARLYGSTVILQAVVGAIVLIGALFILNWNVLALFIAGLASSFVALLGAWIAIRRYLTPKPDIRRGLQFLRGAPTLTLASLLEVVQATIERNVMALYVGLAQLGIYSHSQQYRNLAAAGTKAVARTVWPYSLREARADGNYDFEKTRVTWNLTYLGIALIGVCFALFGEKFIQLLTHDKFTEAYTLAAAWAIYLLIQNAGKIPTALMYAHKHSQALARINATATIIGIVVVFVAIPVIGIWGAFMASLVQQIIIRISFQIYAQRNWQIALQDGTAVVGGVLVIAALLLDALFVLGSWERVGILCVACVVILIFAWQGAGQMFRLIQRKGAV